MAPLMSLVLTNARPPVFALSSIPMDCFCSMGSVCIVELSLTKSQLYVCAPPAPFGVPTEASTNGTSRPAGSTKYNDALASLNVRMVFTRPL